MLADDTVIPGSRSPKGDGITGEKVSNGLGEVPSRRIAAALSLIFIN
ncbi:MAG: hypothetical protein WAZ33_05415 [Lactococcus raffinolactis]|nr:hypothetical protein [Lactococcus raffinolactis]